MNRVAVLGPLSVVLQGVEIAITSPKHRVLLATLLTGEDWAATIDSIADRLWGHTQPRNARAAIHVHVTRLRRVLDSAVPGGGQVLVSAHRGYRLDLSDDAIDLGQLRAAIRAANAARDLGDLHAEKESLATALSLWRGDAFEDIDSDAIASSDATALHDLRVGLQERLFGIEIALGNHSDVVHDLQAMVSKHPLRESLTSQLMLAQYRSGRPAHALQTYRALTQRLAEELGIDPSSDLQKLFGDILNDAPQLRRSRRSTPEQPTPTRWLVSCTLPREHDHFVERRAETEAATAALSSAIRENPSRPAVLAITGPPGAGKTAFAVHLAHQLRDQYRDGQWFTVFADQALSTTARDDVEPDGAGAPRTGDVIDRVLREWLLSSGIAPNDLPDSTSTLSALLRARISDRQVLIVVDNVDDAGEAGDRLAALLPGSGRSAIIITSRSILTGFAAHHAVHTIGLGPLSLPASVQLLHQMLGHSTGHPTTAELIELAELCDRLPLALRIAGAQLCARTPQLRESYLARLREDHLNTEVRDGALSLAATLHPAYTALSADARRLLRLMALVPGGGFTVDTAAVLLDTAQHRAAAAIDELTRLHLITESESGAATLPELFRQFAAHQSATTDTATQRRAALDRLTHWYLTPQADLRLRSAGEVRRHRNTILALTHPHTPGPPALDLAEMACRLFASQGHHIDWCAAAGHGLHTARALNDHGRVAGFAAILTSSKPFADSPPGGEHDAHGGTIRTSSPATPSTPVDRSLRTLAVADADPGLADTDQRAAASADEVAGHLHRALARATALDESDRRAGRTEYRPDNLTRIGRILIGLDRLADGHAYHHRALHTARRNHNLHAVAAVHLDLAVAYLLLNRFAEAENHADTARELFSSLGDDVGYTRATIALGDTYRAARRLDTARHLHQAALRRGHRLDSHQIVIEASIGLALTYRYLDDQRRALVHATESVHLAEDTGLRLLEGKALGVLAVNNLFARQPRRARKLIDKALHVHQETGHELEKSCVLGWLPAIAAAAG
ncbi:BTAD domain-containing putative transcriptional regulator [Nocardia africana]|uniref:BTAD domain-containing putative transcriptional regulator n=1 Tax=Nocardia africana TaxID=134964 RepID=A0ABW6NCR8_9NOCA